MALPNLDCIKLSSSFLL